MTTVLGDLRYSLRTLRKAPGFSIVALLVLALGIGANTAIFSVVNSVILRPLPFPGADRLAFIWETDLKDGIKREGPTAPNFLDWKEQSQSFEDMSLLEVGTGTVTGEGDRAGAERMACRPVSSEERLGVHCASTLKFSSRRPSAASLSIRGVGAPRSTPPPQQPS